MWDNSWEKFQEDAFLLLEVCRCFFSQIELDNPEVSSDTASMSLNYDLVYLGKDNCELSHSLKVLFLSAKWRKWTLWCIKKCFAKATEILKDARQVCTCISTSHSCSGHFCKILENFLLSIETGYNCLNFVVSYTSLSPK